MIATISGKPSVPCADKRSRRSANAETNRHNGFCTGRGVHALPAQRRAVFSFPIHIHAVANFQQQIEFLFEQLVVMLQIKAEQRIRFGKRSATGDNLRAAIGDQIERGELLKHAHRIVTAQHGDGAGEPNVFRARRRSSEDDCRRGGDVIGTVMLADADDIQAHSIGQFDLFEHLRNALHIARTVWHGGDEAVDANFHGAIP